MVRRAAGLKGRRKQQAQAPQEQSKTRHRLMNRAGSASFVQNLRRGYSTGTARAAPCWNNLQWKRQTEKSQPRPAARPTTGRNF